MMKMMTLKKDNKLYDAQSMTEAKRTEKKLDRNHTKMLLVLKKKLEALQWKKSYFLSYKLSKKDNQLMIVTAAEVRTN